MKFLDIGEVSAKSGIKPSALRYYEEIGLLPEAERSAGNQRLYGSATMDRLTFIRHARELGFTLHRPVWFPYEGLDLTGWTNLYEIRLDVAAPAPGHAR